MQSLNPKSLEAINRTNIGLNTFLKNMDQIQNEFDQLTSDLIIGLPYSTYDDHINDTLYLLRKGFREIVTFSLMNIPNTDINLNIKNPEWGFKTRPEPIGPTEIYTDSNNVKFHETTEVVYETSTMTEKRSEEVCSSLPS